MAEELTYKSIHTGAEIDEGISKTQQIVNPNLLVNWYFGNPVNQRGLTEYAVNGYTIDRWFSNYVNLKVELVDGGIKVTNTGTAASIFRQPIDGTPFLGTYTASVLCADVTGTVYLQNYYTNGTYTSAVQLDAGLITDTQNSPANFYRFSFYFSAGASVTFKAAKLELGNKQTLAHQDESGNWVLNEIPDYSEQLDRCRWFFERISAGSLNMSIGLGTSTATDLYIPIKVSPKRANPAAISAGQVSGIIYGTNLLNSTPTSASFYANDNNSGSYTLILKGTYTAGAAYRAGLAAGAVLDFNAEL